MYIPAKCIPFPSHTHARYTGDHDRDSTAGAAIPIVFTWRFRNKKGARYSRAGNDSRQALLHSDEGMLDSTSVGRYAANEAGPAAAAIKDACSGVTGIDASDCSAGSDPPFIRKAVAGRPMMCVADLSGFMERPETGLEAYASERMEGEKLNI